MGSKAFKNVIGGLIESTQKIFDVSQADDKEDKSLHKDHQRSEYEELQLQLRHWNRAPAPVSRERQIQICCGESCCFSGYFPAPGDFLRAGERLAGEETHHQAHPDYY